MKINKLITAGIIMAAAGAMALDYCEVTDVKARQRYPWNGLVDIDFTLDSKATEPYLMNVVAFDNVGKTNLPVNTVYTEGISFKDNPCMVHKDTSRIIWDAAADLPNGFKATNVLISCQDVRSMAISNLYMIVDVSRGVEAEYFPVSYTNSPPVGGWTEEYKLNKIVLRRIEPGTFMMGSPLEDTNRNSNETLHKVTLSKAYYMAVYELTAKQFALIYGGTGGDTRPVRKDIGTVRGFDIDAGVASVAIDYKSYRESTGYVAWGAGDINLAIKQNNANHFSWPTTDTVSEKSLMGCLRSKTGLKFDLPTEAQWEYACRGGSATATNIGVNDEDEAARLISGSEKLDSTGTHYIYVGNYMPNAFGIYDMSGNGDEWCLDSYQEDLGVSDVIDPVGGNVSIEGKILSGRVKSFEMKYSESSALVNVTFNGNTYVADRKMKCGYDGDPSAYWDYGVTYSYECFASKRVVRGGGARSAQRTYSSSVNTSGELFTSGIYVNGVNKGKAAYANPMHSIRLTVTVEK